MSTGWDFDAGQDKVNFTKFGVGISRIRILSLAPKTRWTHWMGKFQRSVNCPGRGCPICEIRKQQKANKEKNTYDMGRKMSMNIWNYETNRLEVMEQGITFFEDLRDIMSDIKEGGNQLAEAILKVRRRGTGKDDTTYRIDIDEITPMEDNLRDVEVLDLDEYFKPHNPEQILQVLSVTAETQEDYVKRWNEIMYPEDHPTDSDEEVGEEFEAPVEPPAEDDEAIEVE